MPRRLVPPSLPCLAAVHLHSLATATRPQTLPRLLFLPSSPRRQAVKQGILREAALVFFPLLELIKLSHLSWAPHSIPGVRCPSPACRATWNRCDCDCTRPWIPSFAPLATLLLLLLTSWRNPKIMCKTKDAFTLLFSRQRRTAWCAWHDAVAWERLLQEIGLGSRVTILHARLCRYA